MSVKIYDGDVLSLGLVKNIHVRDTSSITEQAGYINAETQVTRLIAAGVNLLNFRREFYDYPDGNVPDNAKPDPTMSVGFDMADADAIVSQLNEKASRSASSKVVVKKSVSDKEEAVKADDVSET